jgi:hypothetical protein
MFELIVHVDDVKGVGALWPANVQTSVKKNAV